MRTIYLVVNNDPSLTHMYLVCVCVCYSSLCSAETLTGQHTGPVWREEEVVAVCGLGGTV